MTDGQQGMTERQAAALEERKKQRLAARRRYRRRRTVAAVVILALIASIWLLFQPFAGKGHGTVRLYIPRGAGVGKIAEMLDQNGVISSAFLFEVRATISGSSGDLKPGHYILKKEMSYGDAIDTLKKGPPKNIIYVVIPEGKSRQEIVAIASKAGIKGNFLEASRSSTQLSPRSYGAPAGTDNLEGFLFPATYEIKRGGDASQLVDKQLAAFKRIFGGVDLSYAKRKNLTAYDVLIIASMVEREAQLARERPLIAAVIYNRLSRGMPLGIDATTRYEFNNWTKPLTKAELASPSPYNTRVNAGLPPTPIGNPGLDSIKAAAKPAKAGYLYFVVKPGGCGEHAFSSSEEQFLRDSERYNQAREQAGRSPTDCPQ